MMCATWKSYGEILGRIHIPLGRLRWRRWNLTIGASIKMILLG